MVEDLRGRVVVPLVPQGVVLADLVEVRSVEGGLRGAGKKLALGGVL